MSRALRAIGELDVLRPVVRAFFDTFVNTPRSAAARGARPVFSPSTRPAVQQGPQQTFSFTDRRSGPPASAPAPAPVRRPEPPVAPIFQPPAQPAIRSRPAAQAPAPAPAPAAAPQGAENFVPLDGRQLDMFSGFNRLRNPAGATTAEGFRIGGTTYNPADVMPEGAYTQRIRELARSKGVPEEMFIQQMQRPGESLADVADFSSVTPGTGFFSGPVEFNVYRGRNLLNNTVRDLGGMLGGNSLSSNIARGIFGTAGVGTGLAGVNALVSSAVNPMGPTTADPEVGAKLPAVTGNDPVVLPGAPLATTNLPGTVNPPDPAQLEPAARMQVTPPGVSGAGQVVIRTNGGESNYRQAAANAAAQVKASAPMSEAAKMYAAERAAATGPGQQPATLEALRAMGSSGTAIEAEADLDAWVKSNPVLAYRLMQRSRTLPSQQMPVNQQTEIMSEAGTNIDHLVEGSVKMGMEDPAGRFQGSSDLRQFMAPRSAAYIGNVPVNMYR